MRTKAINIYSYDELNAAAKEKVLEKFWDININYDWWECDIDDAANIGLKITEWDIENRRAMQGEFTLSANEVAANIMKEHGENCETYKTAKNFMDEWQPVFNKYMETEEDEDRLIEIEDEFLKSLLEDYRTILSNNYYYQISRDAVIETIKANEYEFNESGKLI